MPSACAGIPRPRPRINRRLKASKFLDASLGFSAGVMLVASFTSLILPGIRYHFIPETHRKGHERAATMGLMSGARVMLYLDVTLG